MLLAGPAAIALAVLGEWLMRGDGGAINPGLGALLVWLAVLLVGIVSWVRDDPCPLGQPAKIPARARARPQQSTPVSGAVAQTIEVPGEVDGGALAAARAAPRSRLYHVPRARLEVGMGAGTATPAPAPAPGLRRTEAASTHLHSAPVSSTAATTWIGAVAMVRELPGHYMRWRWRPRTGRWAAMLGGTVTAVLAAWLLFMFLLERDFTHPAEPWVWAAMLVSLALTFAGAPRWPRGTGLLDHDPAEPAREPLFSRQELLIMGAVLLAALLLRVWNLADIPVGPYTDEADRALDARHLLRGDPVNGGSFVFFGTGWWGVPSFYFWLLAQSMRVFGDDLAGARMVHALAGVLTVWVIYRLVRSIWSPRAAIVAAGLAAVSDFAIQFSRTAGESTITLFTWTTCFYFLYRGLKHRRPLDFVLSGIAGGFTLLGYASGKLLPVTLAVIAAYILLRWGLAGARRYLPGLALLGLAAFLVYFPNGLYILTQRPGALTQRSAMVSVFTPGNLEKAYRDYNTRDLGVLLARQFQTSYAAFDTGQEKGPFYPTGQPVLPVPWAALWVLGGAYIVWRIGDARYALLAAWVAGGLAGAALTADTPTLQRVAGMVPTLAIVPALFLDRVASGIDSMDLKLPLRLGPDRGAAPGVQLARRFTNAGLGALVLILGLQTTTFYFGPYQQAAHYFWYSVAGKYASQLNSDRDAVYQMDVPEFMWGLGPALFLADRVQGRDLSNASQDLPLTDNEGRSAHFLVFPSNDAYMQVLQSYYPGGTTDVVLRPDGHRFFTAYSVTGEQIDERREVVARYGPAEGPLFEQREPRLGTLQAPVPPAASAGAGAENIGPPAWITYPTTARWSGGLLTPQYAVYRFSLDAPGGASLDIDGRSVLVASAGSRAPVEADLVMARGVHRVVLAGDIDDSSGKVDLRWGSSGGELVPVGRQFLWGGPPGALLGRFYAAPPDADWFSQPSAASPGARPLFERRDSLLGWRSINQTLGGGSDISGAWDGNLEIALEGDYGFNFNGGDRVSLLIDGKVVGARGVQGLSAKLPATVHLRAGEHEVGVRVEAQQDNGVFELLWLAPGQNEFQVVPPEAFGNTSGGLWTQQERPGVPSVDPEAIGAVGSRKMRVVRTFSGQGVWSEARGLAVLPDGRFVIGDTGNKRLLFYGADGKLLWEQKGEGNWESPQGITQGSTGESFGMLSDVAASRDGSVIAALDASNGDIHLIDPGGKQLALLPSADLNLRQSSGMDLEPVVGGRIYVADTGSSRVLRATRGGQVEANFHDSIVGLQPLEQPTDVLAMPDGRVFAVDLRGRVVRLSADGRVAEEWRVPTTSLRGGDHMARWGSQIAITEPEKNELLFFDPARGVTQAMEVEGPQPLNLDTPVGIDSTPDRRLYVLDSGNDRVVVLEGAD